MCFSSAKTTPRGSVNGQRHYRHDADWDHGLETEVASLTDMSAPTFPIVADWTVKTDILGEEGAAPPSPPLIPPPFTAEDDSSGLPLWAWWLVEVIGFLHVAVEMAVAKEIGIRHKPLPWRYCMAEPISSSINFATWCSVTVMLSLLDDDAACVPPLPFLPFPCTQSPPP